MTDTKISALPSVVSIVGTEIVPVAKAGTTQGATVNQIKTYLGVSGINTGDQDLSGLVTKVTTVNGHALSSNVTVTATDVGLGNVDNTSDANKPISTATATALSGKQTTLVSGTNIKTVGGVSLLGSGNIANSDLPAMSSTVGGAVPTPPNDSTKFLNGQGVWAVPAGGGGTSTDDFRNLIINGRMMVDQEHAGASQTFTAGGALAYCVDQFYGFCTGANITGQQVAGPVANTYRYRFTGAASNTGVGFGTRLEAIATAQLASSSTTIQCKLSSSSLTSITWTAYYATTKDSFGTLASPTRTQIATGTWTITSTETIYSANISVPSAATTGIEIVLTGGALLATQTLTIGDMQYESGTTATSVEIVPVGLTINQCKRFYNSTFTLGVAVAQNAGINTGELYCPVYVAGVSQSTVNWQFQTQMRATPTITSYSPGAASSAFWNRSQSTASGAATAFNPSVNGVTVTNQQAAGDVQGNNCGIHLTANARL